MITVQENWGIRLTQAKQSTHTIMIIMTCLFTLNRKEECGQYPETKHRR